MAKPRLPVHRCPTERVKLPRDVAMASVAIASLGCRRVLMDSATVLLPTVEDHVATLSSDSILEVRGVDHKGPLVRGIRTASFVLAGGTAPELRPDDRSSARRRPCRSSDRADRLALERARCWLRRSRLVPRRAERRAPAGAGGGPGSWGSGPGG